MFQFIAVVLVGTTLAATTAERSNGADHSSELDNGNGSEQVLEILEDSEYVDKIFKRETLADPEPHNPHGAISTSSHAGFSNKPRPSHGFLGSHGFHGFGGGHSTRKRDADPHSPHGSNSAFSHGGFSNHPKPSHGFLGSHGFRGFGGGHSTR